MKDISGSTRLFYIVGHPIAQVRTPQVVNTWLQRQDLNAVMVPTHVKPDGLRTVFEAFRHMQNLDGFIVTVPHKTDALALCDEVTPAAQAIGAVNTVRRTSDGRLVGDMFDGRGFIAGLQSQGHELAGKTVLIVGAGGAAAAIAHAFAAAGVQRLSISNRTHNKAKEMADRVRVHHPNIIIDAADIDPTGYDIVVNATSLGMGEGDPLPFDVEKLSVNTLVAEVIMTPEMTPLLYAAQKRGCPIHLGRHMLEHQSLLMCQYMIRK
jgi:shikimate dehydrogenase